MPRLRETASSLPSTHRHETQLLKDGNNKDALLCCACRRWKRVFAYLTCFAPQTNPCFCCRSIGTTSPAVVVIKLEKTTKKKNLHIFFLLQRILSTLPCTYPSCLAIASSSMPTQHDHERHAYPKPDIVTPPTPQTAAPAVPQRGFPPSRAACRERDRMYTVSLSPLSQLFITGHVLGHTFSSVIRRHRTRPPDTTPETRDNRSKISQTSISSVTPPPLFPTMPTR